MKPTIANVRKVAASYGAEVVADTLGRCINVDLPAGRVWAANDSHSVVGGVCPGEPMSEAYADLLEQMSYGVQECSDAQCEYCEGE